MEDRIVAREVESQDEADLEALPVASEEPHQAVTSWFGSKFRPAWTWLFASEGASVSAQLSEGFCEKCLEGAECYCWLHGTGAILASSPVF